jgi:hypothetical protein
MLLLAHNCTEQLRNRFLLPLMDIAIGANDKDWSIGDPSAQELQEQQRSLIGPVQII